MCLIKYNINVVRATKIPTNDYVYKTE